MHFRKQLSSLLLNYDESPVKLDPSELENNTCPKKVETSFIDTLNKIIRQRNLDMPFLEQPQTTFYRSRKTGNPAAVSPTLLKQKTPHTPMMSD
jgi:hypothetical protein